MSEAKKTKAKTENKKIVEKTDLSALSTAELKEKLNKLTIALFSGKEKNTSLKRNIKKEIARNLTKLSNKS